MQEYDISVNSPFKKGIINLYDKIMFVFGSKKVTFGEVIKVSDNSYIVSYEDPCKIRYTFNNTDIASCTIKKI